MSVGSIPKVGSPAVGAWSSPGSVGLQVLWGLGHPYHRALLGEQHFPALGLNFMHQTSLWMWKWSRIRREGSGWSITSPVLPAVILLWAWPHLSSLELSLCVTIRAQQLNQTRGQWHKEKRSGQGRNKQREAPPSFPEKSTKHAQ